MHGIARVRTSEEEALKKKNERETELAELKSNMKEIFEKRSLKVYDEGLLTLIGDVLYRNPDIYTLWNYRREILLALIGLKPDEEIVTKYFDNELRLTESCLKVNPKSYVAWHHRMWVLVTRPDPDWDKELKLCNYYLKLDERNLHCWNYRDFVVEKSGISLSEEIDYSLKKIEENFSNYSAWHYRSKSMMKLHPDWKEFNIIPEDIHSSELELVINAAFTDPNDSSAWFYQKWLLGPSYTKTTIALCKISHSKTFVAFNKSVDLNNSSSTLKLFFDGNPVNGTWESALSSEHDVIWILNHEKKYEFNAETELFMVLNYKNNEEKVQCIQIPSGEYIGYGQINFENNFSQSIIHVLEGQQEMCDQLLEMEPESKWTLLTLAILKNAIDRKGNYLECKNILTKLETLDPKRKYYYRDLFTKWHIEYLLEVDLEAVKNGRFVTKGQEAADINLENIFYCQYWSACSNIDLRNHSILQCNLLKLRSLQCCKVLDLGNNKLQWLKGFPPLPELEIIYLDGNNFHQDEIKFTLNCPKLNTIYLSSVGNELRELYPGINFIEK